MPLSDKGLIGLSSAMMAVGLAGTLGVLAGILPRPVLTPPDPMASPFEASIVGKDEMLTAYQWIRLYILRTVPPSVVLGKDGWLYYRSEATKDGETLNDFVGQVRPDSQTIMHWKSIYESRKSDLKARGVSYLSFVAPNTVTIYPEHLPPEILKRKAPTRFDAVAEAIPDILDLRPTLLERKKIEQIYDSSDTHWNDLGAFAAYEILSQKLASIFPSIRPINRSELSLRKAMRNREVEFMIGRYTYGRALPTTYLEASKVFPSKCADTGVAVLAPGSIRDGSETNARIRNWVWVDGECPSRRFVQDNKSLPKAVVFHDSFLIALNPFFSQNFREVLYVLGNFDMRVVDREKPDTVIHEATERYLPNLF